MFCTIKNLSLSLFSFFVACGPLHASGLASVRPLHILPASTILSTHPVPPAPFIKTGLKPLAAKPPAFWSLMNQRTVTTISLVALAAVGCYTLYNYYKEPLNEGMQKLVPLLPAPLEKIFSYLFPPLQTSTNETITDQPQQQESWFMKWFREMFKSVNR